nr:hypothetical protein [Niallia taxi]
MISESCTSVKVKAEELLFHVLERFHRWVQASKRVAKVQSEPLPR